MPSRKNRMSLIAAILFLGITACGNGGGNSDPVLPSLLTQPVSGICNNDLLPATTGTVWNYYSMGGPNGDFPYTDSITEVHTDGFTLTSQFPTLTLTQEWLCTPEGLVAQRLGGGSPAGVSMQNMIADFKILEVNGLILPKEIVPGVQWEYKISMEGSIALPGESKRSPGTFSLIMQDLGSETITVTTGTFDSKKLQATFEARIDVDFQGSPIPYTINGSSILWYAPGIGLIKSIENIEFSGTPFTSTTELQSYKIP